MDQPQRIANMTMLADFSVTAKIINSAHKTAKPEYHRQWLPAKELDGNHHTTRPKHSKLLAQMPLV